MKINIAIHFFLILSFSYTVTAQDCLPTGITFTTQKQIDNFPINYPSCTNIKGNVRIEERNANNITNLNSLSQITSIEGNLKVSKNTNLTSLKGLNNLTSIGGQLGIWGNDNLENITDLENLISINGHLTISKNNSLMNLEGLNKLTSIGGFFRVKDNDSITSLRGLDQLSSVGKDLWVHNNDNLKNVNGLENLTSITGNLMVTENEILKNLDGLENLTFIGKSLKVMNNDSLLGSSVLNNVTSIGGQIKIDNNGSLVYQNELDKLSTTIEEEPKKVKENKNQKVNVKNANNDKKWEIGGEAGYASMKLNKSNSGFKLFDSESVEIKHSSRNGFRLSAIAKYNIDGRFQFITGLGYVQAEGTAYKITTGSKGGFFSPTVRTSINEDIIQKYSLLEIPAYLRIHFFDKHKGLSDDFNMFFDLGASYKMPFTNESFFTKTESISTRTSGFSLFGTSTNPTTTTTSSYDSGDLELKTNLSGYFAFGFLVGKRTSITFSYTGMNTQGKQAKSIKHKSSLNSVSVGVFF